MDFTCCIEASTSLKCKSCSVLHGCYKSMSKYSTAALLNRRVWLVNDTCSVALSWPLHGDLQAHHDSESDSTAETNISVSNIL